ncbi:MAG TPA: cytochrome c oxidase assembly factor Coa1 family protein [Candidatus Angelobacter sp.]|nr:cytochrome c oxidase assembly factor Coa1 family protein [Candidatus Angelobacter sp.]
MAGTIVLCIGLATAGFFALRAQFRANRVYQESLTLARSSLDLQALLGQPIQEGWWTFVETRHVFGAEFAEWTALIKGPKGGGRLQGVANRVGPSWHYSRLVFTSDGSQKIVDLTPGPAKDQLLLGESEKKVYLVPLGTVPDADLAWAPVYYKAKFALKITVLPAIPLHASAWNSKRRQLIAENLIVLMKQSLPEKVEDQSAILIGVTTADMYIGSFDWNYAINFRQDGRYAVVSTARLGSFLFFQKWNRTLEISRLQKMITKNIYVQCFDVPMSSDYTSAVSGSVMSPEEVDPMSDEIIGAEKRWHSLLTSTVPTISMVTAPNQSVAWNMEWSGKPPTDIATEYFAADLWAGLLIQRRTDFYLTGDFPLQFVRTYISREEPAREFGAGTRDSLDISIGGVPGKYMELTLENGVRTHFDRDTRGDIKGRQAYRGKADYFSPFSLGTIFMRGYDIEIETRDGWHYFFPYRSTAKEEEKYSVLTGYSDPQGRRFEMQRDETGELLRITTPAGKWMNFKHDEHNRFQRIEDSEGRVVNYEYGKRGELVRFADSEGHTEIYRYDEKDQMVAVLNSAGQVQMTISYSQDGWINGQRLADGRTFKYEYHRDKSGNLSQIRFTDPRGYVTSFDYFGNEYLQSLPSKSANPKQGDAQPFLD